MLLATTGCSTWNTASPGKDLSSWSPKTWFKKEYQEPVSLSAIWAEDTLATAGQATMRGFGGRIYFYNDRSQAVPVEGDLVVHGYLTTPGNAVSTDSTAHKRFVFGSEQLVAHFSPSQIGASYSIWVPWDEIGGFREELTLIATFKSKQGSVVQGAPAKLFLPGKSRVDDGTSTPTTRTVSYVTEEVPTHPGDGNQMASQIRTTTIEIPTNAELKRAKRNGVELGGLVQDEIATVPSELVKDGRATSQRKSLVLPK